MKSDHKFIMLERIVKNGAVNFVRNIWLAIAAVAMMGITLTILLFAVVSNATLNHEINVLTSGVDVSFYLKDDVTDQQREALVDKLKTADNVKEVEYVTKEQALKDFREQSRQDPDQLAALSEIDNPLPASLRIKPKDTYRLQVIRDFLERPEIQSLRFKDQTETSKIREETISDITLAAHFFQQAGFVSIFVFIFVSTLIIFNTIRMTIFNRRDELIIMRLLGATPWYIRGPFVVETMIYGIFAAAISIGVCALLFKIATSTLHAINVGLLDIRYMGQYFSENFWRILTIQIAAGIIIGAASSVIATRRYLRVNR